MTESLRPSISWLSVLAERQDWQWGPGCVLYGCQTGTALSPQTQHVSRVEGSAAEVAGLPRMQTGVCVWMESSAASCFTSNVRFHACELWWLIWCKRRNGWSKLLPLAPVWYVAQGQKAFLCTDSGLPIRKKSVASLQSFRQQLLVLPFTIKQWKQHKGEKNVQTKTFQ